MTPEEHKKLRRLVFPVLFATLLILTGPNNLAIQDATSLAPFVPTPQAVVDRLLELAEVSENDVVYDIGCGDGRIVITAAERYGSRGVGIDIDLSLIHI